MIVLDTNVVSELMNVAPHPGVTNWIAGWPQGMVSTTSVTMIEVTYGIRRLPVGRRRTVLKKAADAIFSAFSANILTLDAAAGELCGEMIADRESLGRPIDFADAQIAAITKRHGMQLATRNVKDFCDLGLTLIDPWNRP